MEFDTTMSVASAIAALLSALYASMAARSAAKSTEIALDDHRERHENIHAELIDGFYWETADRIKMLAFACSIINKAVAPNTIISIELHVHERNDYGQTSKLILQPIAADIPPEWNLQSFPLPLNLDPRSAASGYVSFRMPDNFATGKLIDKYEIRFLNSVGHRASVNQYLIRKIENAKTNS